MPWHDQPFSVTVRVARLATVYLAPAPEVTEVVEVVAVASPTT